MPDRIVEELLAVRPERWTPRMVERLARHIFDLMNRRGVVALNGRLVTATGRASPAELVALWPLLVGYLETPSQERDIFLYFLGRDVAKIGLSHEEHAQARYGKSRKWLRAIKDRALARIAAGLNRDGYDPAATLSSKTAKLASRTA